MNTILFFLLFSFFHITSADVTVYKKIKPINLSSLEWEEEEWPNESFREYLNRCYGYQEKMQELKKRRTVFNLFEKLTEHTPAPGIRIDSDTMQDLHLFAGKKTNEPYACTIIDKTHTQAGKVFLYGMIGNPTDKIGVLQQRQAIIKYFVEHPEFTRACERNLF